MSSRADEKRKRREQREALAAEDERRQRRNKRLATLAAVVAMAAAVVGVLVLVSGGDGGPEGLGSGEEVQGAAEVNALFAGIPQDGVALGDPEAPVTVVEFVDLQCPFCAAFARDALPDLVRRYVRPGKVRMELRVLRFLGEDSAEAANMAMATSDQNRMWPFVELFFRNQGQENSGYVDEDFLRGIGESVDGLDVDRALAASATPAVENQVAQNERIAQARGVSSTPTFIAGRTGGPLQAVQLTELTADAIAEQIDPLLRGGG